MIERKQIDLGHTLLKVENGINYMIRKSGTLTSYLVKDIVKYRSTMLKHESYPTLISTTSDAIDNSVKNYMKTDEFKENYYVTAIAIITSSRTKTMILRLIAAIIELPCPIKFFTSFKEGEDWLQQFVNHTPMNTVPSSTFTG